jgi:hypothetical protein
MPPTNVVKIAQAYFRYVSFYLLGDWPRETGTTDGFNVLKVQA